MPIDLGSTIRKTSHWAFNSSILNNILGSSLYLSIVIAMVMILLVMILYPAQKGTKFSTLCKLFVYMFFGSLLLIFLHDSIIKFMFDELEQEKNDTDIMRGVNHINKDGVYNRSDMINPYKNIDNNNGGSNNNGNSNGNSNGNNDSSNGNNDSSNGSSSNNNSTELNNNKQKTVYGDDEIIKYIGGDEPLSNKPPLYPVNIFMK